MKKSFVLMLTLAFIAVLSFSSCKKECTCKTYMDGVEIGTTTVETKGKCSDSNAKTETMGIVTEVKCD